MNVPYRGTLYVPYSGTVFLPYNRAPCNFYHKLMSFGLKIFGKNDATSVTLDLTLRNDSKSILITFRKLRVHFVTRVTLIQFNILFITCGLPGT